MGPVRLVCLLLLLGLIGCDERGSLVDYGLCPDTAQRTQYYPQSVERDLDILLVLDTSPAMTGSAAVLSASLPKMVEALRSIKLGGEIPNVRLGVISADLGAGRYSSVPGCRPGGDGARLLHAPQLTGCTGPTEPWISYTDGDTNVPAGPTDPVARVGAALGCIGSLGSSGCRFSQPLEAARRALDPALGLNPGFLRKDAFLALVFVTAGDDCSAAREELFDQASAEPLSPFRCFQHGVSCDVNDPTVPGPRAGCKPAGDWLHEVEGYASFFNGLKLPGRVLAYVVSGPTAPVEVVIDDDGPRLAPSCQGRGTPASGTPALRLEALTRALGYRGYFNEGADTTTKELTTTICSQDYSPPLRLPGRSIIVSLGGQCLSGYPVTRECELACTQGEALGAGETCPASCLDRADCVAYEYIYSTGETSVLPRCQGALFNDRSLKECGGQCPCWRLIADGSCTPVHNGSPYFFQVLGHRSAPKGAVAILKCETSLHAPGSAGLRALPRCR